MSTTKVLKYICVFGAGLLLTGCRGQITDKPPIHIHFNMMQQDRMEAQEENRFFADGRAMRPPVEGTVARGLLKDDTALYEGVDGSGELVSENPLEVTKAFLYRGQDRYNVFCTPCHGITGEGDGIIMTGKYGYVPAPSFHQDRLREASDGEIYSAIAHGVRTMPSYATQVPVKDRWAIVAYIRALQVSQNASENDISRFDVDIAELQDEFTAKKQREAELAEARKPAEGDADISAEAGEQLIVTNGCQACHSTDGSTIIGPSFKDLFGHDVELESGETVVADEEYIHESIVDPNAKIVKGFPPVMVPYDYLSDSEIKSIIEYIKTLSDN